MARNILYLIVPYILVLMISPVRSFAQTRVDKPELIIQLPHTFFFRQARLSPDRRLLATVGSEGTGIKIWEFNSGLQVRTLLTCPYEDHVLFVDSKHLLIAGKNCVRVVDVWTNTEIWRVEFTGDGKDVIAQDVHLSNGGQFVAVGGYYSGGSKESRIAVYEAHSGQTVAERTLPFNIERLGTWNEKAFLIASERIDVNDTYTRKAEAVTWDDLQSLRSFDSFPEGGYICYTRGRADRFALALSQEDDLNGRLTVFEGDGTKYKPQKVLEHDGENLSGNVMVSDELLLSWSWKAVYLWNAKTGKRIHKLTVRVNQSHQFTRVKLDSPTKTLHVGLAKYDWIKSEFSFPDTSFKRSTDLNLNHAEASVKDKSGSSMRLAIQNEADPLRLAQQSVSDLVQPFLGDDLPRGPFLCYSPSGKYLAYINEKIAAVFDIINKKGLFRHDLPQRSNIYQSIVWSPDEQTVCLLPTEVFTIPQGGKFSDYVPDANTEHPILAFSVNTGSLLSRIVVNDDQGKAVKTTFGAFNPSGNWLAVADQYKVVALIDTNTWQVKKRFLPYRTRSLCFVSNSSLLIAEDDGSINQILLPWGAETRKLAHSDVGPIVGMYPHLQDKLVLTVTTQGQIEWWRLPEINKVLTTILLPEKNWLFTTPDGYLECSSNAWRYLAWNNGRRMFPYDQLADSYRRTQLVRSVVSTATSTFAATTDPNAASHPLVTSNANALMVGRRWAVVIGVSEYQDHRIPTLRYTESDAEAFANWLTSADGGRYSPDSIRLLLGKEATSSNIRDALFEWLKQAQEEDLVVIYFSGHGTPESPDRRDNLFLVAYDTEYHKIAATGFPMWDIETALDRFIHAKRVVVIADACHAGGIGAEFATARRAIGITAVHKVNTGLQNIAKISEGVAVITSSGPGQLSQESQRWGGHGVFTHFLLQGLSGQADFNKDSRVVLGELVQYVSESVRRETGNAQSPEVAGRFDPALTLGR